MRKNGDDHEGKHEEEDSEENRKEVTEKEDAFDNDLENAYGVNIVQEATTGSYCEKCDVTFKSKKGFRKHLKKKATKQMHVEGVMTCFIYEQNQEFM